MRVWVRLHNHVVAALAAVLLTAAPAPAQTAKLDDLFTRLQATENVEEARRIEQEIWIEWSKSGSAAMDLLLERGRMALEEGNSQLAVEHLTALTDHAPDFAEGWNARATAFFALGQFGPAISDIARTLELNPRHYGALSGLALIFESIDQPEKALEVYRKVLEIDPHAEGVTDAVARLEKATLGQGI